MSAVLPLSVAPRDELVFPVLTPEQIGLVQSDAELSEIFMRAFILRRRGARMHVPDSCECASGDPAGHSICPAPHRGSWSERRSRDVASL